MWLCYLKILSGMFIFCKASKNILNITWEQFDMTLKQGIYEIENLSDTSSRIWNKNQCANPSNLVPWSGTHFQDRFKKKKNDIFRALLRRFSSFCSFWLNFDLQGLTLWYIFSYLYGDITPTSPRFIISLV